MLIAVNPEEDRHICFKFFIRIISVLVVCDKITIREFMTKHEKVNYWIKSAENDWKVAGHLFEKGDYPYALFFGHLTIEKLLKAIVVNKLDEAPPFTHRLNYLAEIAELIISSEQLELLEIITDFNLEARYPDEKFYFYKKCTREFTESNLKKIEEIKEWLQQQLQQMQQ